MENEGDSARECKEMRTLGLSKAFETEAINAQIKDLEDEMAMILTDIGRMVQMKYKDAIPDLSFNSSLVEYLKRMNSVVQQSIDNISLETDDIDKALNSHASLSSRFSVLKQCKEKVKNILSIEEIIAQLWLPSFNDNVLINTNLIIDLTKKLQELRKNDEADIESIFLEKIFCSIQDEIGTMRIALQYTLNTFWTNLFSFGMLNNGEVMTLDISVENDIEEKLTALHICNMLDEKITQLCTSILQHFCLPIIKSSNPLEVFTYMGERKFTISCKEYIMRKVSGNKESKDKSKSIFLSLKSFFKHFCHEFESIHVKGLPFVQLIGKKMSNELISTIVRECLVPAVPYDPEQMPFFDKLLDEAKQFHKSLVEMGFFTEDTVSFETFAEDYETIFIDRRCKKILASARSLICKPYTELATVGYDQDEELQTVKEFSKEHLANHEKGMKCDEQYPKLLRFLSCKVSSSCVELVDLLQSVLQSVATTESESKMLKMLQTARNIIDLFISLAPLKHHNEITTLPQMAAIFYNNCYYISHRIMIASISVEPKIAVALKIYEVVNQIFFQQATHCEITFINAIPKLRKLASNSLEAVIAQCRRQLSNILSVDGLFIGLDDFYQSGKCERTLNACVLYLQQISNVWKEIFCPTILSKCLGNLASFFFDTLAKKIIAMEDIRELDAKVMTRVLENMIKAVEELLVDILDRWCDGKGPLAQWFNANDLGRLIRALFQNTEKRALALSKIY
ncbi:unnamed protein product [Dracunculus medinensis]|uniref:Centromere/kinetochore protein zw10 homolog n=1 Tax=Dracunculus medinensis TaxID=318479 RepID=A0A0N4UE86_DRAME|nr:unnamed protein product [Dracunculus medinensis]